MDKINLGSAANSGNGDTGRAGGQKINDNFAELVAALTGDTLWDAASTELIDLSGLPTVNKTNIVAALVEMFSKLSEVDDTQTSSVLKTWSVDKIKDELIILQNTILGGAGGAFDTLSELQSALGSDPNFATTISNALAARVRADIDNQNLTSEQKNNALINLGLYNSPLIPYVRIQGAIVETEGKTNFTAFEVNDKFTYHTATRYCVGKILDATAVLPADLDTNKTQLVTDNLY